MLLGGVGRGFAVGSTEALEPLSDAICSWIWPSSMKKKLPVSPDPNVEPA